MTDRERYQQAFSVLRPSEEFILEVERMAVLKKKQKVKTVAAAMVIGLLLAGGSGTAYAADVGGIQRTIQLWIHGDQTDAVMEISTEGTYQLTWQDEEGNTAGMGGGGVALEPDGSERPLTEEELLEYVNGPEVEYEEDGSVWVYYYDQKIDITDRFDSEGVCYVKLVNGEEVLYVTVQYDGGYGFSPIKYPQVIIRPEH